MTLSIIIANWNTKELIKQCIDSIFDTTSQALPELEVIVIDNASTDGSLEYLKSQSGRIILIENTENLGYAKACNQGMKIAKGKYILLLGSDTIMKSNTLKECADFLDKNIDEALLPNGIYEKPLDNTVV